MDWSVDSRGTVANIRIAAERNGSWEQWGLLTSDRHHDNPKSKLAMQRRHLEQAAERGAFVCDFGDLFCAMQGRDDKRGSKSSLRSENQTKDYFGSLINSSVDFFTPYRQTLAVCGYGNHETAVTKRHEIDLTRMMVARLNDRQSPVVCGGYRGWIRFLLTNGTSRQSFSLYYTHGGGGGGPVTKGVIKTNRRAVYLPDAHIVVGGHIHESWMVELVRARLSSMGSEYADTQTHLALPTYKEEFFGADGGFHHERESPPKPLGAWWIRFFYNKESARFDYEFHRAK